MEKNTLRLFLAVCLCVVTMALSAQSTAHVDQPQSYAMASDYSDCSRSPRFSLPLDIDVTESYWLKGYVQDLTQGVSAYLYADTDFKFEVFVDCFFMVSVYPRPSKRIKPAPSMQREFRRNQRKMVQTVIPVPFIYASLRLMAKEDDW